ncbi:MAG TPA: ABC transporter substrate-binding protein [Ktedonobacteraceae bacterium]|nr:ABC transporter substrate-binding protein [Ktedonobacteraceae bacterium]
MKTRSRKPGLVACIILALILGACGSPGVGGEGGNSNLPISLRIMVGGLDKQIYLPNMLAQRLGFFAQEGLDVTLIDEASGQSAEDEVMASHVEAGSGSYNHTIELQASGKHMECVVQLIDAPGEAEVVSTKAANTIRSVKDLVGKDLGVTELGAGTQTLTILLLHNAGIAANQVDFVPVGAGDTFIAAMQQGVIDAGMTTEPTISQLVSGGVGRVLVDLRTPATTQAALGGPYPFICVFMQNSYVNAHKAIVQRLVNAYVMTLKWIHTHTAQQITDMMPADYYADGKAQYVQALQNQLQMYSPDGLMPAGGPQFVLQTENETNFAVKGQSIDLSATYTNEFVNNAP